MRNFLPILIACFLLVGQFGCSDGSSGGGGGSANNAQPELPADNGGIGGGGGGGSTLPTTGDLIPADPNCTGNRIVQVGVAANVAVNFADGTTSPQVRVGDANGNITIPCSSSYQVAR
jgi:hypothetical protein